MVAQSSKVSQVLSNVIHYTLLRFEDPGWFLARAFQFTSRTSQLFLSAVCSDFNTHIKALAHLLSGLYVVSGGNCLPTDAREAETQIRPEWESVLSIIDMRTSECPRRASGRIAVEQLMRATTSSLSTLRNEDLLGMLADVGQKQSSALKRQALIEELLQLKKHVRDGRVTMDACKEVEEVPQSIERQTDEFRKLMYSASLNAWVMKPLIITPDMREGSIKEDQILKALPQFCSNDRVVNLVGLSEGMTDTEESEQRYIVEYIRTTELVGSQTVELLVDSPDAVMVVSERYGGSFVAAVDVHTMTATGPVLKARETREKYGALTIVPDVGRNEHSCEIFSELVPSAKYRTQCIHHAATLGVKHVSSLWQKGA